MNRIYVKEEGSENIYLQLKPGVVLCIQADVKKMSPWNIKIAKQRKKSPELQMTNRMSILCLNTHKGSGNNQFGVTKDPLLQDIKYIQDKFGIFVVCIKNKQANRNVYFNVPQKSICILHIQRKSTHILLSAREGEIYSKR